MFSISAAQAPVHSIACLGLDGRVEASFKSLLGILQNKMRVAWTFVENVDADVVVYNPGSPLAQAMLRSERKMASGHIFVPCSVEDPGADGLSLPLRADRLVHCLDNAVARMGQHVAHESTQTSLCERLDAALQTSSAIAIAITSGSSHGIINPARKMIYWPHALDTDAVAQMVINDVTVQPLHTADLNNLRRMEQQLIERVSWDAPFWAIGVSTSRGQLLKRLNPSQPYRLSRWPDFGLIGRRSSDIRCTALLTHKSMTPQELVRSAGFSEGRVHGFLNACALCGLLEEATPETKAAGNKLDVKAEPAVSGGMLQRIRRAFVLGTNGA